MVVKRYAGITSRERLGNGVKAGKVLDERKNTCSDVTRQELYVCLNSTARHWGQEPHEFLYHMETARNRQYEMGEHITDGYFSDIVITALTP